MAAADFKSLKTYKRKVICGSFFYSTQKFSCCFPVAAKGSLWKMGTVSHAKQRSVCVCVKLSRVKSQRSVLREVGIPVSDWCLRYEEKAASA